MKLLKGLRLHFFSTTSTFKAANPLSEPPRIIKNQSGELQTIYTGLSKRPHAQKELILTYQRSLQYLSNLPETYPYRLAMEKMINSRLALLNNSEKDPSLSWKEGPLEEVLNQANSELHMIKGMTGPDAPSEELLKIERDYDAARGQDNVLDWDDCAPPIYKPYESL